MNREIKFRVWNEHDRVMLTPDMIGHGIFMAVVLDGQLIQINKEGSVGAPYGRPGQDRKPIRKHELRVMQYTGRNDNRGVEAYEGDVYHCGYQYKDGTHKYGDRNVIEDIRTFDPEDEFTIIGNIYENPELRRKVEAL